MSKPARTSRAEPGWEDFKQQAQVADGGWSSELRSVQRDLAPPVELLNLSQPDVVLDLAKRYVRAGARFLSTNTFSANRLAWRDAESAAGLSDINRDGARLARRAAVRDCIVCGTIGPSGRILAAGEVRREELADTFVEAGRALAEGGADALLLETFSELEELQLAVRALKAGLSLPVIASLSFDSGPQRTRTVMGAEACQCAAALDAAGADVIGSNCGAGIATALPAVVALHAATTRPIWVKPSAGVPELVDGRLVYRVGPDEFAHHVPQLLQAGANIIGGCCGVGPEHINKVAMAVRRRR